MSAGTITTVPRISGDATFKRNSLLLAAGLGAGLGYLVFLIVRLAIPGYSTDFIYLALPELLRGLFTNLNNYAPTNPMAYLSILLAFFVDFPSCLVWIVPGFLIGYQQNKKYINIKIRNNGWRVFWHAMYLLEIIFVILAVTYAVTWLYSIIPGTPNVNNEMGFLGSSIMQMMFIFISPFLWLALLMCGLGGYIGSKVVEKSRAESELVIEEIEPEEVFEEEVIEEVVPSEVPISAPIKKKVKKVKAAKVKEKKVKVKAKKAKIKGEVTAAAMKSLDAVEGEDILWPEAPSSKMEIEEEDFGIKTIDIDKLKSKVKASSEEESTTMPCPSCKKELPADAKFCNFCGYKM